MTTSNGSCGFVSERKPSDSVRGLFIFVAQKSLSVHWSPIHGTDFRATGNT
jgi:hypothetical protein